ncbi:MAG: hypothetical protein HYZ72_11370 [Deltaproteobacteria bacterium]|nr:hypothetical protein [Deltaproteobacteria bacterium]
MSGTHYRNDQRLAFAVTRFIEDVHHRCPQARLEPMTPYEDEDFTLAVIVPTGTDEEAVLDQCLAASVAIEDEMDLHILPRVRSESF